jgi:hypothetical protein
MISLATEADRTLYFDFLPINIGTINGFAAKFQLYTVPGQVYYNATRKLVLRGVDGVVFVADSQPDKMDENIESLINLEENLTEYGYDVNELPMVIQYNKRDLPGVLPVESLNDRLNTRGLPYFEASATVGNGVFGTLKLIIKLVLDKAKDTASSRSRPTATITEPEPQAGEPAPEPQAVAPAESAQSAAAEPEQPRKSTRVSTQPIDISATAQATAEKEPEPAQYRPYPGSEQPDEEGKRISVSNFSPPKKEEGDDGNQESQAAKPDPAVIDGSDDLRAPAMAPSLKRRAENKKRGFFKRLFGIK